MRICVSETLLFFNLLIFIPILLPFLLCHLIVYHQAAAEGGFVDALKFLAEDCNMDPLETDNTGELSASFYLVLYLVLLHLHFQYLWRSSLC